VSTEAVVKTLEDMLDMGANVNIYLMHGGWYCLEAGKKCAINVQIKKLDSSKKGAEMGI
jgi:hypothetical protein